MPRRAARKDNDVAGYPNSDRAVEVDLSRPQADRQSIYAAPPVPELWVLDGDSVSIKHLGVDGKYFDAGQSRFLPVYANEVTRRLLEEDRTDKAVWEDRLRAWAREELTGRGDSGPQVAIEQKTVVSWERRKERLP